MSLGDGIVETHPWACKFAAGAGPAEVLIGAEGAPEIITGDVLVCAEATSR